MSDGVTYISGPSRDRKGDDGRRLRDPHPASAPEGVLVGRARSGDREAFGELYRRHRPALLRVARLRLGAGAEDAVAETFLRAWTALPRYRDTGVPFVAWLHGIARNVAGDELRRASRTEARAEVPDSGVEPRGDDRLELERAVTRLPDDQRTVIELKFFAGMTNPEVAAVMDRTVGAVNALQWRALRAMRQWVER